MIRNVSRTTYIAVTTALALTLGAGVAVAKPRVAHVETNAETREIKLWIDIRKGGKVIKSPESSKLKVLVDGKPYGGSMEIKSYGDNADGMYVVFVVDSSAIWERSWDDIREGIKGFVSRMRGDKHEVALVILREGKADTAVPFTTEINDIGDYLDGLAEVEGISPKLFKALSLGIKMHGEVDGKNWRRIIVFGSDLEDETSLDPTAYAGAYTDLMKELDRTDVELSMVFMTAKIDAEGNAEVDPKILKKAEKLCEKTNGFFVALDGVSGIPAGYKEVADNINSMAVVTLSADTWPEAGSHLVSVRYDEIDSKEFDIEFEAAEEETPDDICEFDADCSSGFVCDLKADPYPKCKKEEVKPPPKEEGWAWWIWGLIGLGGLGVLVVIIALIAGRSTGPPPQQAAAPVPMGHGPCMECGQPNRPGPQCQQQCAQRARGRFVVTAGDMTGKTFYLMEEVTTFGKADGNTFIIMDGSVSSKHFGVKIDEMKYELADFGSTNGTFINGLRAKKQYLKTGDVIRVGHTEMTFHYK